MSEFNPKIFSLDSINSGKRYKNGDGVQAETINKVVEASAYAQAIAENAPNLSEVANEGTPKVEIETHNGEPRFKFSNLGGGSSAIANGLGTKYSQTFGDTSHTYCEFNGLIKKPFSAKISYQYQQLDPTGNPITYGGLINTFINWAYNDNSTEEITIGDIKLKYEYLVSSNKTRFTFTYLRQVYYYWVYSFEFWTFNFKERLDVLNKQVDDINEFSIHGLNEQIHILEIRYTNLSDTIRSIDDEIKNTIKGDILNLDGRVTTLDGSVGKLDLKVTELENKEVDLSPIEKRLKDVEALANNVDGAAQYNSTRIDTIDGSVATLRQEVTALENKVTELEEKEVEVDLSSIEERLDGIDDEIQGIHKDIDITIGGEIDALTNEVNALKNLIGDLDIPTEMQIVENLATVPYRITKPTRIKGEISSLQGDTTPDQATEFVYSFDTEVKWKNPNDYTNERIRVVGVGDIFYNYTVNSDNSVETKIEIENAETQDGYQEMGSPKWKSLTVYAKRK